MNTTITFAKPKNPLPGDTYYDMENKCMKQWNNHCWYPISSNMNIDYQKFIWIWDTKEPYAKILDNTWAETNRNDIVAWLDETGAGEYIPALSAIAFNSHDLATLFELKWG